MTIRVKINKPDQEFETAEQLATVPGVKLRLDIRKTIDGNLIISDHPDIDIILMPASKKILALATKLNSGTVYGAQNRLFNFLAKHGVIKFDSIQGGNIFASMEADIAQAKEVPEIKVALINIALWLQSEEPSVNFLKHYDDEIVDDLTAPDKADSTELGQVPQAARKGTILPSLVRGPYGLSLYNYYGY